MGVAGDIGIKIKWNEDQTPYDAIGAYIVKHTEDVWNDNYIVSIALKNSKDADYKIKSVYFGINRDEIYDWAEPWWEGQEDVRLLWYVPVSHISRNDTCSEWDAYIHGMGPRKFYCKKCGHMITNLPTRYCPECGSNMLNTIKLKKEIGVD